MKFPILIICSFLFFSSCKNKQGDAKQLGDQIQNTVNNNKPSYVATTENGFSMKAKINGKEWEAASMMPPEVPARIIGDNNGESISLPYDRRDMVVGEKTNFSSSAVDLLLHDDIVIWGGHKGEMKITKVDENSAEGTFYFTATSTGTDKTVEVTDGFFRILFK